MRTNDSRLLDVVAGAIADGETVDWAEVRRRVHGTPAAGIATNLEWIQRLECTPPSSTTLRQTHPPVHPFVYVLIPGVGAQVLAGAAGFVLGPSDALSVPGWLLLLAMLVFGVSGVVVAVAGRWDRRTAPLAGVFLCIASATALPLIAILPAPGPGPVVSAFLFEAFFPFFLWWFVEEFPRTVRFAAAGHWIHRARLLSIALGLFLFVLNAADRLAGLRASRTTIPAAFLRSESGWYWLALFVVAMPALLVVFARLRYTEGAERRRARLFLTGLAVGMLPLLLTVIAEILIPPWSAFLRQPEHLLPASLVVYGFVLTVPITLGYAAVAREALDLRFALGRAARVALARGTLWALAVGPWVILAGVLWLHRDQPVAGLFRQPYPSLLMALGLLGIGLRLVRDRLLAGIEHRLLGFRGVANAALAAFAQRLAAVRGGEQLGELVGDEAARLLDADSCFLLVLSEPSERYVSLHRGCGHLDASSALAGLAAASSDPICVDGRSRDSWLHLLPERDRLWVADGEIQLIVPVINSARDVIALIAFGPSSSGRPYATVHRDAATAVASTIALSLTRGGSGTAGTLLTANDEADEPASECWTCGRIAGAGGSTCQCGGSLRPAVVPQLLNGKFRLVRVLGQGGMGVVYLGRDVTLDRLVALKTLPKMHANALLRLRREARSMASFVHPNLALIFGAETWRGVPVLVVEYLAGGTLSERIGSRNDPVFVVTLGIKLAGALAVLHDKGLLHRDVKPANIGFSDEMAPKLLDFGLAQIIEDSDADVGAVLAPAIREDPPRPTLRRLTERSCVVGTPLYLSPEILAGEPPSIAQDLWALHVVLWESLVGRHPMAGMPHETALDRIRSGEMPSARAARPDCPKALEDLLHRGLDLRRDARPATATELGKDLAAVLASLS